MRLSELSTDKCMDVLCEITPYVANIATDKEISETISKAVDTKGMTKVGLFIAGTERITMLIPALLKNHRNDVYSILSVINETSVEDIGRQNIMKTMLQIREVCKDKELAAFFRSWAQREPEA